jgi:hypothetical protein
VFKNSDKVAHNTNLSPFNPRNRAFNQVIPPGGRIDYEFKVAEAHPTTVACNVHTWMKSYIIVRDGPYAAVSRPDGSFALENLPVGEHEFRVRHDRGFVTKATLGGRPVEWDKGLAKFTIRPGKNDLGEIKLRF